MTLEITGISMWPSLRAGDRLVCAPAAQVDIGDVVCARAGGRQLLHRVVARAGRRVLLQGDLCPRPDPALDERAVLLRAVALIRRGRRRPVPPRPRWPGVWRRVHAALRGLK